MVRRCESHPLVALLSTGSDGEIIRDGPGPGFAQGAVTAQCRPAPSRPGLKYRPVSQQIARWRPGSSHDEAEARGVSLDQQVSEEGW
jgi:hypothetical protein